MSKNIICEESHKKCLVPQRVSTKLRMLATAAAIGLTLTTFSGCTSAVQDLGQYVETVEREETNRDNRENLMQEKNYEQMLEELKVKLESKLFSDEVNQLFIDTFDMLYSNYNTWEEGYKDFPTREEYIEKNLINVIDNISEVDFYDIDSRQAQELLEEGKSYAWTERMEDNSAKIVMMAEPKETAKRDVRCRDIEYFYHEIRHCAQSKIDIDYEYYGEDEMMIQIILEGGATYHMKFVNKFTTEVGGMWSIVNGKGDRTMDYNKENCLGYLVDLNGYEKLVYLVGYDVMDKVEKGETTLSDVKDIIEHKYGAELADDILKTMNEWKKAYNNNWQGDKVWNLSIKLEKLFLDCIKSDISLSKTREELDSNIKLYEHYKNKNLPQVMDELGNNITDEVFDIYAVSSIIEGKLQNLETEER